jgi:NADPH:quinone reductase-like Zn-dependent oxidoreductase
MKSYKLTRFSPEGLHEMERPDARPGPGEALVRLQAASLNFRDVMIVSGAFPGLPLPFVPVSDGAGVVVELGEGATGFSVGDLVCPVFLQGWQAGPKAHAVPTPAPLGGPLDGVMREYAAFPTTNLIRAPGHLSAAEAATLPTAGLTAWKVLSSASIQPGQTVLVEGTGGVSIFALRFAKAMGARVILTSSSDAKLKRARELGADATINYREQPNWGDAAFVEAGGGVDVVVDVGGQATLGEACKAIREGGFIGVVGALGGITPALDGLALVFKQARLQGFVAGNRQDFLDMCRAIELHKLKPVLDRQFGFKELRSAYNYMTEGAHFGKIGVAIAA